MNERPVREHRERLDRPLSSGLGIAMVVMTLVGWSSVPLFLRFFAQHIDVWTSNGWRYGAAAVFWAPVVIVVALRRGLPLGLWRAALIPSLINAVGQVCFAWAHYKIEPGLLTFGLRSQILFAAIGAYLLFPGERAVIRTPGYLMGALLVIAGTSGAMFGSGQSIDVGQLTGVGLAIGSGLLFACYGLSVRRFMRGVNSVIAFAAISQYTAVVMVGLMLWLGERRGYAAWELTGEQFVWLMVSALIGIALGHVFYYMSIARLGVAVSAGVLQLQPFVVGMFSYLLFAEVLTATQWASGAVAVSGAMMMLGVQWLVHRRTALTAAT